MKTLRAYDWQLSDASRGYRLTPGAIEFDDTEKTANGLKQELLSAMAVAGLVLAAYALL